MGAHQAAGTTEPEIEDLLHEIAVAVDSNKGAQDALADLLDAMDGNREIVGSIIGEFLVSYRERLDKISAAVTAGSAVGLQESAHQFKGSLGLFCRTEPLELTQRLIEMGEQNTLAEAPQTLELLEQAMEKLVTGLAEFAGR